MPESRRILRVEPYFRPDGGRRFAIYDGDKLIAVHGKVEVEEAVARWQAQIDAGQQIDGFIGGLMYDEEARAENAALRAEIDALRASRDHREVSRRGGDEAQRRRREDGPPDESEWVDRACAIAKNARVADPAINSKDIINDQIIPRCTGMDGFVGFDMLMKYMRAWEAAGRVTRKVKPSSSAPRGKRKK
jgi:hypothetical protein